MEQSQERPPIYTIGYGNRAMSDFLKLLHDYDIHYLVDLRSKPYSRFKPEFSQRELEQHLKQAGIRYLFMGDTLGGRPDDSDCYLDGNMKSKVDYTKLRAKPFFQEGIERIHTAWEKQLRVVLMCSELRPEDCHRSKLIGTTLEERGITVAHIDEEGSLKTQAQTEPDQLSLFGLNPKLETSRKKYRPQDTNE